MRVRDEWHQEEGTKKRAKKKSEMSLVLNVLLFGVD